MIACVGVLNDTSTIVASLNSNSGLSASINNGFSKVGSLAAELVFAAEDWISIENYFQLTISPNMHRLGIMTYVNSVERKVGDIYKNVDYSYQRLPNGVLIITSHVTFDGRIIIMEG